MDRQFADLYRCRELLEAFTEVSYLAITVQLHRMMPNEKTLKKEENYQATCKRIAAYSFSKLDLLQRLEIEPKLLAPLSYYREAISVLG